MLQVKPQCIKYSVGAVYEILFTFQICTAWAEQILQMFLVFSLLSSPEAVGEGCIGGGQSLLTI